MFESLLGRENIKWAELLESLARVYSKMEMHGEAKETFETALYNAISMPNLLSRS